MYVDDIKLAGKKQNINLTWKILMKEVDLGEPTSFVDHVYLGCTQRECETSKDIVDNFRNMFESRISAGAKEKLLCWGKLDADVSSWSYEMEGHAKKCVERKCELANKMTRQLYTVTTPCLDDHHFKEDELGCVGELSKVCSQIVLICLCLAHIGRPDILWSVKTLARAVTKWTRACDKRLARLISYFHHTSEFKQFCHVEKHCTTMQVGTVSGLWLCGRSWRLKIDLSENFVHIWKSHVWSHKLEVWETNFCFAQFHGIWCYLLMQVYAWMEFLLLICWIWKFKSCILLLSNLGNPKRVCRETCCMTHNQENTPRTRLRLQFSTTILNYATSIMFPQTWSLLNLVWCSTFLRIMKRWSWWSSQQEVQPWDTYPEPSELRLIGYSTESAWTLENKSNMLTPKNNSQTYWQRTISHVMSGIIFSICSISACSAQQAAPKLCRKEGNKEQEKREFWQSRSRRWTWSRILLQAHPVRKVRISKHKVQGILPLEVQIKMTQGQVLKWGWQMQRWEETRCCRNEPGSEFSRTCKETCRRKFRHQRRGRLEVAAQLPHISCERSTPRESPLELATTTQMQARRQSGGPRCEYVDMRMFMIVTQQVAVHLGNEYLDNLHSTKNQPQRTVK